MNAIKNIGLIYPSNGEFEAEFYAHQPPCVILHFSRWELPDPMLACKASVTTEDIGLAECAKSLELVSPDVISLACTSASFVDGSNGDYSILESIAKQTKAKVSSTSTAYIEACHALNIKNVSIASIYQKKVTDLLINFLAQADINTIHQCSKGWTELPSKSQQPTETEIIDFILDNLTPDADALLLPETDLKTVEAIRIVENIAGIPVLSAIQVTLWHASRLAGNASTTGIGVVWTV